MSRALELAAGAWPASPPPTTPGSTTTARLRDAGLLWHDDGQVTLRGPLLGLLQECDRALLALAAQWHADDEAHPPMISAEALDRVDYLDAFPQVANFPVVLADDEANLDAFRRAPATTGDGTVQLTATAPVRELLTPAACYHLYIGHAGEELTAPLHLTTRNTCFRREAAYEPLRRQRCFQMREVVCLGTRDEVAAFLGRAGALVDRLLALLDLPVGWQVATDPFFRPGGSHRHLFQRLHQTKREAVYRPRGSGRADGAMTRPAREPLAIASVNRHEDRFGEAFAITRAGSPAFSGCVAFGLDRWLFALTDRFGPDPAGWPDVAAAAAAAVDAGAADGAHDDDPGPEPGAGLGAHVPDAHADAADEDPRPRRGASA